MFIVEKEFIEYDLGELTIYCRLNLSKAFDGITIANGSMFFQFFNEPTQDDIDFVETLDIANLDILQWKQDTMWRLIQSRRDSRKSAGIKIGEHWFHSDDSSRIQYLGLVMMGDSIPTGINWKTMSGEFIEMSASLVMQIFTTIAISDIEIFGIAEQHKANMLNSPNPELYDFSGNWPPGYGE